MIPNTGLKLFKIHSAVFLLLFFLCPLLHAQTSWNEKAKSFVAKAAKNRYKYSIADLKSAVETCSGFITTFDGNSSREVQSSLFLARANLQMYIIEYEAEEADNNTYRAPREMVAAIASDFVKAQQFCPDCKCDMFDNIQAFYLTYGKQSQLDSLETEARLLGRPTDHTYIGVDANYVVQKNVAGLGLGVLGAWTVLQPKKWINSAGKKYRKCDYDYPMAVGLFFVGYETSLSDRSYNAVKVDPIWLNYIFSVHPLQLLYADWEGGKTFIYRPEIGFSFSTFAVNYALNFPVNPSFNALAQHNISIRFTIPTLKIN